ncbi:MAG: hypothetical protein IJR50_08290 [Treponema sp.]|nr:hypothetical protein [Treponema sp.]
MASVDFLAAEMTQRYGTVQRARGYFLYTRKGVRLTDMYQEGGRAILGWRGTSFTVFKNAMSRGITGSFDTDYTPRIAKAACALLKDVRTVFICESHSAALSLALTFSKERTSFWKAWSNINWHAADCVVIAPPFPWASSVHLVAVKSEVHETFLAAGFTPPNNVRLAAPLAAGIARSLYDMIAIIPKRTEKDWFLYDTVLAKYWTRTGPYLYPKVAESVYADFLRHCLDCALVISPDYNVPSIVPFGVDKGVFTKLKNASFEV